MRRGSQKYGPFVEQIGETACDIRAIPALQMHARFRSQTRLSRRKWNPWWELPRTKDRHIREPLQEVEHPCCGDDDADHREISTMRHLFHVCSLHHRCPHFRPGFADSKSIHPDGSDARNRHAHSKTAICIRRCRRSGRPNSRR